MKVQIYSDFVCPFCYIGKTHLEAAIKAIDPTIEIEMMSFELDSQQKDLKDMTMAQYLADKYGMSIEEANKTNVQIKEMAQNAGLNFNFDIMKLSNTFKAHKVFQYAKTKKLGNPLADVLLDAYFTKGADLNDDDTLIQLSKNIGLSEAETIQAIQNDELGLAVRQDQQNAINLGVKGVPHFIIDDQVFLSGAQPIETFKDALLHVKTLNFNTSQKGLVCDDNLCDV